MPSDPDQLTGPKAECTEGQVVVVRDVLCRVKPDTRGKETAVLSRRRPGDQHAGAGKPDREQHSCAGVNRGGVRPGLCGARPLDLRRRRDRVAAASAATSASAVAVVRRGRHVGLQHLSIVGCRTVTGAGVEAVAAGCPGLQQLSLANCSNVTDGGVEAASALPAAGT